MQHILTHTNVDNTVSICRLGHLFYSHATYSDIYSEYLLEYMTRRARAFNHIINQIFISYVTTFMLFHCYYFYYFVQNNGKFEHLQFHYTEHLWMKTVPYSQKLWRVSRPWVENSDFSLAQNNWINKRQKYRNCFKNVNIFKTIPTSELFLFCFVGGSSCCSSLFSGLLCQSCYGPVSQLHMGTAGEHLMWSNHCHFCSLDSVTFYSTGVDTLLAGTRPLIFTHFCK